MLVTKDDKHIIMEMTADECSDMSLWLEVGFVDSLKDVEADNVYWVYKWSEFIVNLDRMIKDFYK